MTSRLYISGYWPLEGNHKNSENHYLRLLPSTLAPLRGGSLKFFSDDAAVLDQVIAFSDRIGLHCEPFLRDVHDLPAWSLAGELVQACERMHLDAWLRPKKLSREKGSKHYWRDFKGSGPLVYRQLLSIWLSKVSLVAEEARQQLTAQTHHQGSLAWVDASLARCNQTRRRWRYWRVLDRPGCLSYYRSNMRCYGVRLPLQAGFLTAEAAVWLSLENLFLEAAKAAASMAYAHDEETVLAECHRRQPELFHAIDAPRRCWRWGASMA